MPEATYLSLSHLGVITKADLLQMGSAKAYQRIQTDYPDAHLSLCYYLYSLEGSLQNKDWRTFTEKQKANMEKKAGI